MNEMYPRINRNARPNNNQFITYYLLVRYLLRIQQHPVNNTYSVSFFKNFWDKTFFSFLEKKIIFGECFAYHRSLKETE